MKIDELRGLLKGSSPDMLMKIISELYKHVPKALKVSNDEGIDLKIRAIREGRTLGKIKPAEKKVDFQALKEEIDTFAEYAHQGYYNYPNRIVSKSERSKWRFVVMRQIKALKTSAPGSSDYPQAVDCLVTLFKVLTHGCREYIFSTQDPFASIGIDQGDFFKMICDFVFVESFSYDHATLETLIDCATIDGFDMVTVHETTVAELVSRIPENDPHIPWMIDLALSKIASKARKLGRYDHDSSMEDLAYLVMGLYFREGMIDKGFEVYWNTCVNNRLHSGGDNEVLFYCMVMYSPRFGIPDEDWLRNFDEYARKLNEKPRDALVKMYNEVKLRAVQKQK